MHLLIKGNSHTIIIHLHFLIFNFLNFYWLSRLPQKANAGHFNFLEFGAFGIAFLFMIITSIRDLYVIRSNVNLNNSNGIQYVVNINVVKLL